MTGGGGSGAVPTVETINGLVTNITVTGGDSNYTSNPTITLSALTQITLNLQRLFTKKMVIFLMAS